MFVLLELQGGIRQKRRGRCVGRKRKTGHSRRPLPYRKRGEVIQSRRAEERKEMLRFLEKRTKTERGERETKQMARRGGNGPFRGRKTTVRTVKGEEKSTGRELSAEEGGGYENSYQAAQNGKKSSPFLSERRRTETGKKNRRAQRRGRRSSTMRKRKGGHEIDRRESTDSKIHAKEKKGADFGYV